MACQVECDAEPCPKVRQQYPLWFTLAQVFLLVKNNHIFLWFLIFFLGEYDSNIQNFMFEKNFTKKCWKLTNLFLFRNQARLKLTKFFLAKKKWIRCLKQKLIKNFQNWPNYGHFKNVETNLLLAEFQRTSRKCLYWVRSASYIKLWCIFIIVFDMPKR